MIENTLECRNCGSHSLHLVGIGYRDQNHKHKVSLYFVCDAGCVVNRFYVWGHMGKIAAKLYALSVEDDAIIPQLENKTHINIDD